MKQLIETRHWLNPSLFNEVLERAHDAPAHRINIMKHRFQNDPTKLEWVFNVRTDVFQGDYEISSLWNICTVMPEFATRITRLMAVLSGVEFKPDDFYIVRTKGNIPIHKDIQPTLCKFNFGVKNTNFAMTRMYDDEKSMLSSTIMEDGRGYLINPHTFHDVTPCDQYRRNDKYRYIATFKIMEPYENIARRNALDTKDLF